jgi:hypothetical protein
MSGSLEFLTLNQAITTRLKVMPVIPSSFENLIYVISFPDIKVFEIPVAFPVFSWPRLMLLETEGAAF